MVVHTVKGEWKAQAYAKLGFCGAGGEGRSVVGSGLFGFCEAGRTRAWERGVRTGGGKGVLNPELSGGPERASTRPVQYVPNPSPTQTQARPTVSRPPTSHAITSHVATTCR